MLALGHLHRRQRNTGSSMTETTSVQLANNGSEVNARVHQIGFIVVIAAAGIRFILMSRFRKSKEEK